MCESEMQIIRKCDNIKHLLDTIKMIINDNTYDDIIALKIAMEKRLDKYNSDYKLLSMLIDIEKGDKL